MALHEATREQQGGPKHALPSETYTVQTMPATLSTFDMTSIYLAAIFFIGNAANVATFGVVSLTYLLIGALTFFLPCVIVTAQLGALYPYEGSLYNWTCRALGNYWGFFAGLSYWIPNVLAIVGAADGFVTYIQGINNTWLIQPWQQGLVILIIIAFTWALGTMRMRTTQNVINVSICLTLAVVVVLAVASVVWFSRHGSATPLNHPADWSINTTNFPAFGLIALLYLGVSIPLNMGGELRGKNVVSRHLLWGTALVLVCYGITTLAPLIVRGSAIMNDPIPSFEEIATLDTVFGKLIGSLATVCILSFYLVSPLAYNVANARLLFVASVDQRIPLFVGRLNRFRVPANAILFQSVMAAVLVVIIFFIAPYIAILGKPGDLATKVYNSLLAAMTLLLALSTIFYFVDLVSFYRRDQHFFLEHRIVPLWLLGLCVIVAPLACLVIVVDTLQNSWIPLIPNNQWWIVVGGFTVLAVFAAAMLSMIATSQAEWENLTK